MKIQVKEMYHQALAKVKSQVKNSEQVKQLQSSALARWQQLSMRERIIVAVGGAFLILFVFYLLIWEPLSNAVYQYREDVISNKILLLQLAQAGPEINSLRTQVKRSQIKDQAELLSVVEKAVRQSRVQGVIAEIGLGPQNTVKLRFDDVPFDELITWLIEMQQKQGVVVQTFDLVRLPEMGHVKVQMTVNAV